MISKGPSGLRRAGFEGSPPHPPSSISLGVRLLCPGATAEGSGPSGLHKQVFQKWTARGRVSGRLTAKGLSLFFGKALWPALETALHGVEEGRSQCVEEAEAGKGSPQLQPFSPRPPAAIHGAPGGVQGGVAGAGARHSHCASLGPRPQGCSRPQALPGHKRGRGLVTDNSAPQRSSHGRRARQDPTLGATQPDPRRAASLAS